MEKNTIYVQLITAVSVIIASFGGAYLSADFALQGTKEEIRKDMLILSASNANDNAKEIKKRAEIYLITLFQLLEILDNERVYVDEAEKLISKMNEHAQGLLIYGGPELGASTLRLNLSLKGALISTSKEEALNDIKNVMESAKDWYPVYYSVIQSYDRHTMPEKSKADFQNKLVESLFMGLNKSLIQN